MGKEKQKILVVVALGALVLAGVVYFGIVKTYEKIGTTNDDLAKVEAEIKKHLDNKNDLKRLEDRKKQIDAVVEDFAKILPDDATAEHYQLAEDVNEFKDEANIKLNRFDPLERKKRKKEEAQDEDFLKHQFKLEVEGRFFDICRLLNLIEKTEKFLKIDSFHCYRPGKADRDPGDLTQLVAEVTMSTYTYKRKKGK